jgi:hypothetical protein
MKLSLPKIGQSILTILTTISMSCLGGCVSNHPDDTIPVSHHVTSLPDSSHIVWCGPKTQTCYQAAEIFCGNDKWKQVIESDFNYPMMLQEGNQWRLVIACQ